MSGFFSGIIVGYLLICFIVLIFYFSKKLATYIEEEQVKIDEEERKEKELLEKQRVEIEEKRNIERKEYLNTLIEQANIIARAVSGSPVCLV